MKKQDINNTRLIVVRHCSTLLNDQKRFQGTAFDLPLSEKGKMEAQLARPTLQTVFDDFHLSRVIVSDTLRSKQTAELLIDGTYKDKHNRPISITVEKRLNPFGLGTADGKKEKETTTFLGFPVFARHRENLLPYFKRVKECLLDILATSGGQTVLIVTHKDITGLIDVFLNNEFFANAPKRGLENGEAKLYNISHPEKKLADRKNLNFKDLSVWPTLINEQEGFFFPNIPEDEEENTK